MADGEEELQQTQDGLEKVKLRFEFFKHLTTLNVASAVILLAVYRDRAVNPAVDSLQITVSLVGSMLMFSVSLLMSLGCMHQLITLLDLSFEDAEEGEESVRIANRVERWRLLAGGFFVAGLLVFTLEAIGALP